MAAKPTEEWRNSSPIKIDDGGLSSDKSTSYEEEAHPYRRSDGTRQQVKVMALGGSRPN